MEVNEMLEARHETLLEWDDPWEACGPDGNEITANVTHRATVHDCINIERRHAKLRKHPTCGSNAEFLLDFISVNWARVIPANDLCDRCGGER